MSASAPRDPGGIVVGGRFRIFPEQPLPSFDSPLAKAAEAADTRASGRNLFALVCRPDLMPRLDVIPQLARLTRLAMVNPIEAALGPWPETGGRRMFVIFEKPAGDRVIPAPDGKFSPPREDEIVRTFLAPLLPVLKDLGERGIKHRAIRADNLFYSDSTRHSVMLGECVSAPPGISQPLYYEPIDAAIAQPSGRGGGEIADDLYALGVLLTVLMVGGNPVAGLRDEAVVESKIRSGSYATLVRDTPVSLAMMEPLRGLLCDDPDQRWTIHDLKTWVDGQRLSPKQPLLPIRAARAISFAGKEYWTRPGLSFAMGQHWSEAGRLVTGGALAKWLRLSLSDEESAAALDMTSMTTAGASNREDRLISRALMVLEPSHPIRFRNISARIEGVPQALAIEFEDPKFQAQFLEFMEARLPQIFIQSQLKSRTDHASLMKAFDMFNHFIDRKGLGGGVERALYEANPGWPCLSPLVREYYVADVAELLPALERAAGAGAAAELPIDADIAGFCAARLKSVPDKIFKEIGDTMDLARARLSLLGLLAKVQSATDDQRLFPALGEWVGRLMEPVVEEFHSREFRATLAAELERTKGSGDLAEMYSLLGAGDIWDRDQDGFAQAQSEYSALGRGIAFLEAGALTSETHVRGVSRQIASLASATVSGLAIVFLALVYVT